MKKIYLVLLLVSASIASKAQNDFKGIYLHANEDSSQYIKFTFLNQVWLRYGEYNAGTLSPNGDLQDKGFDIGLRRTRIQLFGNVYKNTFIYMQMGINNFSPNGQRKPGIFFHDALIEHAVIGKKLSLGAGLTGWNGLSRYSSASIGTILSMDAPLFAQSTNDRTDQFLRKLGVYAKGQISKLDYRISVTTPMAIQQSGKAQPLSLQSNYNLEAPNPQLGGYFGWDFFEQESNLTPYATGSYLGTKKVLKIGAGFQFQKDAMWNRELSGDTVRHNMENFAADVFLDYPLDSDRKDAVTFYFGQYWFGFGPNYIQNIGAMNPVTGSNGSSLNGGGTAAPILGTGNMSYTQLGYLLPVGLTGETIRLQPYGALTQANFQALDESLWLYDIGINLFKNGHSNKITFNYQNRPVYSYNVDGTNFVSARKGLYTLQLQVTL